MPSNNPSNTQTQPQIADRADHGIRRNSQRERSLLKITEISA
jgi:hypothetical protein